jgi:hypothetical protein
MDNQIQYEATEREQRIKDRLNRFGGDDEEKEKKVKKIGGRGEELTVVGGNHF